MGYDIYGFVQKRVDNGWENISLYKKNRDGVYERVSFEINSEAASYIWSKGSWVNDKEQENFYHEMFPEREEPYDPEEPYVSVKSISLAALKYYEATFKPNEENGYDGAGNEDWIKTGLKVIVNRIETAIDLADEYYISLDDIRFIFFESC